MRIGLDLMGSDSSPRVLYQVLWDCAEEIGDDVYFVAFGCPDVLSNCPPHPRIQHHLCAEFIDAHESPLQALRQKTQATVSQAVEQLRDGRLDALVSAGNTGALLAASSLGLAHLPGVERPALMAVLPTRRGRVSVLDVGGSVQCKPKRLLEHCRLGAAYQSAQLLGSVRVGLLNIGVEAGKGTQELQHSLHALRDELNLDPQIDFVGNVEGRAVFRGDVDVLVTDGFTGNIFVKAAEGMSELILGELDGKLPPEDLEGLQSRFNHVEYPGALVTGVDGLVLKCHGSAEPRAVRSALQGAIELAKSALIAHMRERLLEALRHPAQV